MREWKHRLQVMNNSLHESSFMPNSYATQLNSTQLSWLGDNAMTSLALWTHAVVHMQTSSWVELSRVGVVGVNWPLLLAED